jgi:hypothetical protein
MPIQLKKFSVSDQPESVVIFRDGQMGRNVYMVIELDFLGSPGYADTVYPRDWGKKEGCWGLLTVEEGFQLHPQFQANAFDMATRSKVKSRGEMGRRGDHKSSEWLV